MTITIGTQVLVRAVASRQYDGRRRSWVSETLPIPKIGIITGLSKRYDGMRESGYGGEEPEPSYFVPSKQHRVWMVRFGLSRKEIPVFHQDIEISSVPWTIRYQ